MTYCTFAFREMSKGTFCQCHNAPVILLQCPVASCPRIFFSLSWQATSTPFSRLQKCLSHLESQNTVVLAPPGFTPGLRNSNLPGHWLSSNHYKYYNFGSTVQGHTWSTDLLRGRWVSSGRDPRRESLWLPVANTPPWTQHCGWASSNIQFFSSSS